MRYLLIFSTVLLLAGCSADDPPAPGTGAEADAPAEARLVAYSERLFFLSGPDPVPRAAVFDFVAHVDSTAVHRSSRAWTAEGERWQPLVDTAWQMAPMRDPWRLMPHGPIRLVVDREGELDALLFRSADEGFSLEIGGAVAEWSPGSDTQVRLRRAELATPGGAADAADSRERIAVPGALVDVRLGSERMLSAEEDHAEAYLTDGRGLFLVVLDHPDRHRRVAWLSDGAGEESWENVRLEPSAYTPADSVAPAVGAGAAASGAASGGAANAAAAPSGQAPGRAVTSRGVPSVWRITAPRDSITGELRRVGATAGASAEIGLFTVRGWIEGGGEQRRRSVYGIVRHGRE